MVAEAHRIRHLAAALPLTLSFVIPTAASAQWGGEIRGQMGFGGDRVANVQYSDGSESDLKLGTYFTVTMGPILEVWSSKQSAIELQGMAGWSGWSTGPENTEDRLRLNRFPVELLAFYGYRFPERDMTLRFGGGATYHIGGGISGSGSMNGVRMDMDNTLGVAGEAALISGILSIGLRYTQMTNTVEGFSGPLSGSSLGLYVGLTTPRN